MTGKSTGVSRSAIVSICSARFSSSPLLGEVACAIWSISFSFDASVGVLAGMLDFFGGMFKGAFASRLWLCDIIEIGEDRDESRRHEFGPT